MVDDSCNGFDAQRFDLELNHRGLSGEEPVRAELQKPTPTRMWAIAKAFDLGLSVEEIHQLTRIDRWFLAKLFHIHQVKTALGCLDCHELQRNEALLREAKRSGFADKQIAAQLRETSPKAKALDAQRTGEKTTEYVGGKINEMHVRGIRKALGVNPVVKQIDTLAAEFPAETNYLYLTYNGCEHDVEVGKVSAPVGPVDPSEVMENLFHRQESKNVSIPEPFALGGSRVGTEMAMGKADSILTTKAKAATSRVIVLGCGPYRIGSSVEFDWCGVACIKTLRQLGHEAIVINCNPETVSTDYDVSDRLYFDELSNETVLEICQLENPGGVVVSVGGQTPNNLAMQLHEQGIQILGTSVEAIDACENRYKFSRLCDSLRIDQPEWSEFTTTEDAFHFTRRAGYPVLVRPSYVLSGAAMRVVASDGELERFLKTAAVVSRDYPVVISKYIAGAKEVELDAVGSRGEILNYAIAEHVENAGVHSGDASLLLPAQKLFVETHRRVKMIGQKLCKALKISGPFNIQFICKENEVKVIECNLRASRSMPFISKTYNVNFIDLATRAMLGVSVRPVTIQPIDMDYVCAKVPKFSFDRLKNSDPRLGVEMQSTGEVACFGVSFHEAFLKGMIANGFKLPAKNVLVCIGPSTQKLEFMQWAKVLQDMGFKLYATKNTYENLKAQGDFHAIEMVYTPLDKREPNALTLVRGGKIDLVVNVPNAMDSMAATSGFHLRRAAVDSGTPLIVDIKIAVLCVMALHRKWTREQSG